MKRIFIGLTVVIVLGGIFYSFVLFRSKDRKVDGLPIEDTRPAITDNGKPEVPDGWNIYESDTLGYFLFYPEGYVVEPNGNFSITILKPNSQPSFGPANFIYISVVPSDQLGNEGEIYNYNPTQFEKLNKLSVNEKVSLADTESADLSSWFTYTRIEDAEIDGYPAKVYKNIKPWEFPSGTTEMRYVIETEGTIYILGYYYGGDTTETPIDEKEAFNILSTFQLR